jgi:hypothetical protein
MTWIDDEVIRGKDPDAMAAYEASLAYYLERDGRVSPRAAECPAAERLVERGEAVWVTCLTLGRP